MESPITQLLNDLESVAELDLDVATAIAKTFTDDQLDGLVKSDDPSAFPLYRKIQLLVGMEQ